MGLRSPGIQDVRTTKRGVVDRVYRNRVYVRSPRILGVRKHKEELLVGCLGTGSTVTWNTGR